MAASAPVPAGGVRGSQHHANRLRRHVVEVPSAVECLVEGEDPRQIEPVHGSEGSVLLVAVQDEVREALRRAGQAELQARFDWRRRCA